MGTRSFNLAVRSNCYEAIEFLVEKLNDGQLLNQKDEKGNTILHLAVARKQFHVTKFLLDKQGIDVNSMNQKSCTPLDVLLDSTCEHGDLVLGEIIRAAGGKTSREVIHQSPAEIKPEARGNSATPQERHSSRIGRFTKCFRCFRFAHHARTRCNKQVAIKDTKNSSSTLMIVATLIATITFQAVLNPPGGFKQDSGSSSYGGEATLDSKLGFSLFLAFDMVGLFASICIILLLLCVNPQKGIVMKFLRSIMWLAAFSTTMAVATVIRHIFPSSSSSSLMIFIKGSFCILAIAALWVCI